MPRLRLVSLFVFIASAAFAQNNPLPTINQPLKPASVAPGSGGFVLYVTGTGFAPTAVLNWNGQSRVTIVNSSDTLQAVILASDVAKPGTASITITNPAPGGGTSQAVNFPVRQNLATVNMSLQSQLIGPGAVITGDFNNDGRTDVAVGITNTDGTGSVELYLGNGNGTFQPPIQSSSTLGATGFFAVDVNNDGKTDLLVNYEYSDQYDNFYSDVYVLFGNGDGTFSQSSSTITDEAASAVGDWNGDGKLDVIMSTADGGDYYTTNAFLGNGDGTFTYSGQITGGDGLFAPDGYAAVGDFNGDGRLDLAFPSPSVTIAIGNGDGTFQKAITYPTSYYGGNVFAADLNGDGKLDLVTNGVSVMLGNGDGTFSNDGGINIYTTGFYLQNLEVGDFNGDGHLDLAIQAYENQPPFTQEIKLLLGKGDGTFEGPLSLPTGKFSSVRNVGITFDMADFNGDGKLDLIWGGEPQTYTIQQNLIALTPASIAFGNQNIDTTSAPQTVTATNIGTTAINITSLSLTGPNPSEYAITNSCGSSIAGGASCPIQITFTPTKLGVGSATLQGLFQGQGTAQLIPLSGFGVPAPRVTLTPIGLSFPTQLVGTKSLNQNATLTNVGSQPSTISSITISGPFTQTNNCGAILYQYNSCTIQIVFAPAAAGISTGVLTVTDNASGSPQTMKLSGIGTLIQLSATGVNFGNQKVGTTSAPVPVNVTNTGRAAISVSGVSISGTNSGDFAETNNCGSSLGGGQTCTVWITFTPSAMGSRSATLNINDSGGGSPQTAALVGTGT